MPEISENLQNALNEQIREELESAYIYIGMSTWFAERSLNNLAHWFDEQAKEEYEHAEKFAHEIIERGGNVKWPAISEQKQDWENILEILEAAYDHEVYITNKIKELYKLAHEAGEYETLPLLLWFLEEQVEEEASSSGLVDMYKGYRNDFQFDHHVKREED